MIFRVTCAGIALSLAGSHTLACENPPLAQVPTPEEAANLEQNIGEIQNSVLEYQQAMQEYTACIQEEVEQARADGAPELVQNLLVRRNNAAVAEAEAVIAQFNSLVETVSGGTQIEQGD